jgi:hypothetical protein
MSSLVERDIAERQTASVYLKQLVGIGVLEEGSAGRRKCSSIRSVYDFRIGCPEMARHR